MDKRKNEDIPPRIRIYKPTIWSKLPLWGFMLFVALHYCLIVGGSREVPIMPFILLPCYAIFFCLPLTLMSERYLAIYENGIEYRNGNTSSFSRWEDLQQFGARRTRKSRVLGIHTSYMKTKLGGSAFEQFFHRGFDNFIPLDFISLPMRWDGCWSGMIGVDMDKFAETELGRDLMHYAPHLFEIEKEKRKRG